MATVKSMKNILKKQGVCKGLTLAFVKSFTAYKRSKGR